MSDNFHFDLTGVPLETALGIAFGSSRRMVGWYVEPPGKRLAKSLDALARVVALHEIETEGRRLANRAASSLRQEGWELRPVVHRDLSVPRMVLFWADFDGKDVMQKLPAPMGVAEAVPFVKSWLGSADYGHEPDHDGDNSKGCRVYNEAWTHIGQWHAAFAAIEPVWLMHGK